MTRSKNTKLLFPLIITGVAFFTIGLSAIKKTGYKKSLLLLLCVLGCSCQSQNEYHWISSPEGMELYYRDHKIGVLLQANEDERISSSDKIEMSDSSLFKITRTFTVAETIDSVCLSMAFEVNSISHYAVIPSVTYNGNNYGHEHDPKGFHHEGRWWTVSYRATPIPGATYSEGERFAVAFWGENPIRLEDAFSCSIRPDEHKTTHCLLYPEEEMPLFLAKREAPVEGFRRKMSLEKGTSKIVIAYLHVSEVKPQHRAIHAFLQKAWQIAEHESPTVDEPEKIWQLAIRFAKESLWTEESIFKGFSVGLVPDIPHHPENWRKVETYEIGWAGQNASLANSLLSDYLKTGDKSSLEMGLACLDTWARYAVLPNGLFIPYFTQILYKREGAIDACNLGTAALNFFEASDLAGQCQNERPVYEKIALDICRFVKDDQQENGVYGRSWTYDGECSYREGTVGCFLVPPMIEAYRRTNDKRYLESAIRAYNHYISQLNEDGYTTSGALDTWCIDKESAFPLLRSALKLYRLTQDKRYLDDAIYISCYLSTWLWHYNDIHQDKFTGHAYTNYKTFGGTSVSTIHRCHDPWGVFWVSEWIELSQLTHDPQWKEKALATWRNGCQLISDGTLEINGRLRPAGSQNEVYFNCNWSFTYGWGTKELLVAWPGSFRLETLRRLPDWNVLKTY